MRRFSRVERIIRPVQRQKGFYGAIQFRGERLDIDRHRAHPTIAATMTMKPTTKPIETMTLASERGGAKGGAVISRPPLERGRNGCARVVSGLCQFLPQSSRFGPFAAVAVLFEIR
jgi:hypothetical protein